MKNLSNKSHNKVLKATLSLSADGNFYIFQQRTEKKTDRKQKEQQSLGKKEERKNVTEKQALILQNYQSTRTSLIGLFLCRIT